MPEENYYPVQRYSALSPAEINSRIMAHKAKFGDALVILAHHYQRDEVVACADFVGDSLKLSQRAASRSSARWIVFCGVHFMAEAAAILSPQRTVILPDLAAGCSLADMAEVDDVEQCFSSLGELLGDAAVVPVAYINSSAAVKALVGGRGGAVCTSSNAARVIRWALSQPSRPRVLFLPDEHLGRNSGHALGIGPEQMCVWDPQASDGGIGLDKLRAARLILWKGHCSIHQIFRVADIEAARSAEPGVRIIVHPECPREVVAAADDAGSTEYIIKTISNSAAGSSWAVGTEQHMVARLGRQQARRGVKVRLLGHRPCVCPTMYRITAGKLLWVLDELAAQRVVNHVTVDSQTADYALKALERMLSIGAGSTGAGTIGPAGSVGQVG